MTRPYKPKVRANAKDIKIYVESFRGREHLDRIKAEAQAMVDGVLSEA